MSTAPPSTPPRPQQPPLTVHTHTLQPDNPASPFLGIPTPNFGPAISLDFLQSAATPIREKVHRVQQLEEEAEKLDRELNELNARLQLAEQRTKELASKEADEGR